MLEELHLLQVFDLFLKRSNPMQMACDDSHFRRLATAWLVCDAVNTVLLGKLFHPQCFLIPLCLCHDQLLTRVGQLVIHCFLSAQGKWINVYTQPIVKPCNSTYYHL